MIRAEGVVHRYDGTAAVDGVSVAVADGECLLLAGPNGSGKTTLVRHFNGLLDPDEGTVTVDGTPVAEDLVAARSAVGMVFQEPRDQFVAATVGADVAFGPENLGLDRDAVEKRVREALDAVGMVDRRADRIADLSGGERARVAVAGALAMDPAHLVLDEPFAGLDWPARQSVRDRVAALRDEGRSVVLVTHDLRDAADLADRVVVLADGAVAARGTVAELRDRFADLGVRPPC